MKTNLDFNEKFKEFLVEDYTGMEINIPGVLEYVDYVFTDLIKIPGFKFKEIKTKFGLARVHTNLEEIMPLAGKIINQELEDKINFVLKVEYEIERRLAKRNLDNQN